MPVGRRGFCASVVSKDPSQAQSVKQQRQQEEELHLQTASVRGGAQCAVTLALFESDGQFERGTVKNNEVLPFGQD